MMNNMNTTAPAWPTLLTGIGVVLVAGLTLASSANIQLPVLTTDRAIFFALLVIGFVMCAIEGVGRAFNSYGMTSPISILGAIVGILALILAASVVFGFKLPLIADDRATVYAIGGIILIKLAINAIFALVVK